MIKLKNKNLIILGGSGFIGMNIVKYYSDRNIKVATYNKSKPKIKSRYIKWIKIDLLKENEIKIT